MNTDPILNDPKNPLVSILLYDYDGQHLRKCLDSIFNQDVLTNFEIVLIDDATGDGSWNTALEFLDRYPRRITINRNRRVLGQKRNLKNCMRIARGKYLTVLTADNAFLPDYIRSWVQMLDSDPYAKSSVVFRPSDDPEEVPLLPSVLGSPLVSILCYNYNYGRYLRQCLESVFAQTYQNIELCFSDNASTDESWSIALEFARKYPEKMHIARNRKNFGPDANFANSYNQMHGKYFVNFCSDDVLEPDYVERCVNVMEANPNSGMVLVHRSIIDEHGRRTEEPSFYNRSCIIPGEQQAAVYMMAGVNPSVSQIMYRSDIVGGRTATGALVARYYGTRILDFNISVDYDVAYIKEPLLLHRIHSQSDTNQADASLLPVLGLYVLNHQFADIASVRNLTKVTDRLPKSLEKLARLGIRYSVRSLLANDESVAKRYFHLALAIDSQLVDDATALKLQEYWTAGPEAKSEILDRFKNTENLAARSVSYDPPPGSISTGPDGRMLPNGNEAVEAA